MQVIGTGTESRGVYYLQPLSSTIYVVSKPPSLLHHCLGHPSLNKLKKMVLHLSHSSASHVGLKYMFDLYFLARSIVGRSLFLIFVHFGVLSPCYVTSILGYRYFVTFIDDFSRSLRFFQ